jgi:hypothetical protein
VILTRFEAGIGTAIEAHHADGAIADVADFVTIVQGAVGVVDGVAELAECSAVGRAEVGFARGAAGSCAARAVFRIDANADATCEALFADGAVADVADFVTIVSGTLAGIGIVAKPAEHFAFGAGGALAGGSGAACIAATGCVTAGRLASRPGATGALATRVRRGLVVVVTTASDRENDACSYG